MDFLVALFELLGLYSAAGGLGEHLQGLGMDCSELNGRSLYNLVFIYLFVVNSLIILNYYYGIFNRRPFNRLGWWFLNTLAGAVILFTIAFVYPYNDLSTGNYCSQLSITEEDCFGFGLTAAIFSFLWSCILSVLIKWKSSVNKKVPF